MLPRDFPHLVHPGVACFHPAGGTKRAMILRAEFVAGLDVAVEQAAIIDHARDYLHIVFARSRQTEAARPRLERIQDHHRPVDQRAEMLEAMNDIEREAISGTGSDAKPISQSSVLDRFHSF